MIILLASISTKLRSFLEIEFNLDFEKLAEHFYWEIKYLNCVTHVISILLPSKPIIKKSYMY